MAATSAVPVDPSNAEQLRAWDGDEGAYWADTPSTSTAPSPTTTTAARRRGDRRIGPGPRHRLRHRADDPRRRPARRPRGSALGVDLSSRMLDVARRRAAARGRRQRDLRAGRRPGPPVPGRRVRRRDQPDRRDVLRRPRRRVREHRPGAASPAAAWCSWRGSRSPPTSGSARSPARSRPVVTCRRRRPTRPGRSRCPTPTGCGRSCRRRVHDIELDGDDGRHVVRRRRRRRPPVRARPAWAGCSTASTTPAAHAPSTGCNHDGRPQTGDGVVFGSAAWTITRHAGDDALWRRPRWAASAAVDADPGAATLIAALDEQASIQPSNGSGRLPSACCTPSRPLRSSMPAAELATSPRPRRHRRTGRLGASASKRARPCSAKLGAVLATPHCPSSSVSPTSLGLELDDASFDAVLCERVFQHLASRIRHGRARPCDPPERPRAVIDTDWGMHAIHGPTRRLRRRVLDAWRENAANGMSGRQLSALLADAGIRDTARQAETMTSTDPQQPSAPPFRGDGRRRRSSRDHPPRRRRHVAGPARRGRPPRSLLLGRDHVRGRQPRP